MDEHNNQAGPEGTVSCAAFRAHLFVWLCVFMLKTIVILQLVRWLSLTCSAKCATFGRENFPDSSVEPLYCRGEVWAVLKI